MKLPLIALALSTILIGCGMDSTMKEMAQNNPNSHARMLAAQNGCLGCHAVDSTVLGPAWRNVSKRYNNEPTARESIINSISNGSRGRWNNEEMPAFAERMSKEDIEVIADYILGLSK
jgi:cytochrome c